MSNQQGEIPKMQASEEDIALRQKQLKQRRLAAQRATQANNTGPQVAAASVPKQTLAVFALILTILMGAFAGFLFMQLQQANAQLKTAEGVLNVHAKNLAKLNDQLSATDENANLSVDALRILLKGNTQEIRKLWDLTNKTNKPNIGLNNKEIAGLKATVGILDKRTVSIDRKVSNVDGKIAVASNGITANKRLIDGNKNSIGGNSNSIAELKASIELYQKSVEDKLSSAQPASGAVPAGAESRIQNNEQAIRSIDATRQKLNGSMAEVESQFNEMKLEIEDIQIRLDRMQNAMTGTL